MQRASNFIETLKNRWIYLFITIFIIIIYGDSIFYGYVNDDHTIVGITFNEVIYKLKNGPHFRPLWFFSYIATNSFIQSSYFDHFINIFLYISSCGLAYKYATTQVTKTQALLTVVIWITLPWTVFPVVWISQRNDLIMYIFVFMSLLAYSNKYFISSSILILFSFFGKVVSMFFPLYYVYRGIRDKNTLLVVLNLVIFIIVFLLAAYGYSNLRIESYVNDLDVVTKIFRPIYHLVDSSLTQFIPIPFFVNYIHIMLYISLVLFAIISLRIQKNNIPINILLIILLLMLPTAISSEIRIVGLESFFILLLLSTILKIKNKKYFIVFLLLFFSFNFYAIYETKKKFATYGYDINKEYYVDNFYQNEYYGNRRNFLLKIINLI